MSSFDGFGAAGAEPLPPSTLQPVRFWKYLPLYSLALELNDTVITSHTLYDSIIPTFWSPIKSITIESLMSLVVSSSRTILSFGVEFAPTKIFSPLNVMFPLNCIC